MKSEKLLCLLLIALMSQAASSQVRTSYAEEATGKILGNNTTLFTKTVAAARLSAGQKASLKKCLSAQLSSFYSNPLLNPPKGFSAEARFYMPDAYGTHSDHPPCVLTFGLHYLEKTASGDTKRSMDGTLLGIETNNLSHFIRQVGNFWKQCDELKVPLFFEQPPISDSTADYIELDFSRYGYPHITPDKPFRIVLRNKRPLFVPLTRKEFLAYLVAKADADVREQVVGITDTKKLITEQEKLLSEPALQSSRALIESTIAKLRQQVSLQAEELEKLKGLGTSYRRRAAAMPAGEASSPARLDYHKDVFEDPLQALVAAGINKGTTLYKVNPAYHDTSPQASAAQLVIIYYTLPRPRAAGEANLNYLEKKTEALFKRIDYRTLKMAMQ